MKEIGKERKIAIAALIVAILMLTVAFAAMSRTLKINGTAKVDSAAWDIHFKSAKMTDKKGDAREVVAPVIDNGGINLTLKVGLRKPKDEITYEAVIENKGDIDAEIESIEYPTLTEDQAKIIEFVATYQNGDEISKSQEIKSGGEKIVKIVIRFKDITDESLLAKETYDIPLTFKINYIQKGQSISFDTESVPGTGGDIVVDDDSKAVLASTDVMSAENPTVTPFANSPSPVNRSNIKTLSFVKESNSTRTGNSWDASALGDGSITGYYTENSEGLYDVVIESSSNIYAPVDSTAFFAAMSSLKEINFNNFKTNDTTNMMFMFAMNALTNLDLTSLNTSNVTDMSYMFAYSALLTSLNLSGCDVSNVVTMANMFYSCSLLTSINFSNFDTSNVTNMNSMFRGCSSLLTLDLDSFNTGSVEDMDYMFAETGLTSIDLSTWNTSNVTTMGHMFADCLSLTSVNLSNFNVDNIEYNSGMGWMFSGCKSLSNVMFNNVDFSKLNSHEHSSLTVYRMFELCENVTIYVKNQVAIDCLEKAGGSHNYIIKPLQS